MPGIIFSRIGHFYFFLFESQQKYGIKSKLRWMITENLSLKPLNKHLRELIKA